MDPVSAVVAPAATISSGGSHAHKAQSQGFVGLGFIVFREGDLSVRDAFCQGYAHICGRLSSLEVFWVWEAFSG